MKTIIKEDILEVLRKAAEAVTQNDFAALVELSNHTIHDASIFQEDDPLTIAVFVYALAKVMQRCVEKGKSCPPLVGGIRHARELLERDDENGYRAAMKELLREVSAVDAKMKMYIQEVVQKARLKKGGKIHEHGISIARTAELLGLSQWELQSYIGRMEEESLKGNRPLDRLQKARELFR